MTTRVLKLLSESEWRKVGIEQSGDKVSIFAPTLFQLLCVILGTEVGPFIRPSRHTHLKQIAAFRQQTVSRGHLRTVVGSKYSRMDQRFKTLTGGQKNEQLWVRCLSKVRGIGEGCYREVRVGSIDECASLPHRR